jgi:2-octaprenylphenol hydroxylase
MKHNDCYDLIIVGSGIVGSTLALLLARSPLKILLLDNQTIDLNWNAARYDLRVSAVNRLAEKLFRDIDIWQAVRDARISPYQNMCVWDQSISSGVHFSATNIHQPNLGYIIENKLLQKTLIEKIKQHQHIELIFPIQAKAIETNESEVKLYTDQKIYKAKLLVGSDGVQSWVRKEAGIDTTIYDYQQLALVCQVTTENSHQKTAWQRFLPSGPLAFLPLSDPKQCSIVWSTAIQHANYLQQLEKKDFLQELTQSSDHQLAKMLDCSDRILFPLSMIHAKNYVKPRIALIGDSAHKIHPLAGQGLNLGLADAYKLHEIILETHKKQRDIGHISHLRKYERAQKPINQLMATSMTVFNQLFSNENSFLKIARNTGFKACNQLTWAKNYFAKQALGTRELFYVY